MPYDPLRPPTPPPVLGPDAPGYTPRDATATNYDATERQVRDRSLVANQLTGLLDKANPYMQQAETQGLKNAGKRGLLNSSMAVGAVEGQRIAAALPIAQQDAATFGNQDLENQRYVNEASRFGAENATRVDQQNADAANRAGQFNAETQAARDLAEFGEEGVNYRANLEADMRAYTANLEASSKEQEAFMTFANESNQQFMVQVSEIMRLKGVGAQAKEAMIADLQAIYKANFDLAASVANYQIEWPELPILFETDAQRLARLERERLAAMEKEKAQNPEPPPDPDPGDGSGGD